MRVLVVNAGSSSLKLRVLGSRDQVEGEHDIERWKTEEEAVELAGLLDAMATFEAVGHRVVHGGRRFRDPVLIDADTDRELLSLSSLAPLHQPRAVAGIGLLRRLYPDLPQVACFDTEFHATLPAAASTYALPRSGAIDGDCSASVSTGSPTRTLRGARPSLPVAATVAGCVS